MSETRPPTSDADEALALRRVSHMRYLWLIGLTLYLAFILYIGLGKMAGAFASIDFRMLLGMILVTACSMWIRAVKWRIVLGKGRNAIGLYFVSKLGGEFSPGRVGELAPLLLPKHRTSRIGAWIVLDRLMESGATVGLGILGLLFLGLRDINLLVLFCTAIVILIICPLIALTRRNVFLWVESKTHEGSLINRGAHLMVRISTEIFELGRILPVALCMTLFTTSLDLVASMFLYLCFGYHVTFALLAVVQCAHGLTTIIPLTPNATGVPYLVAAGLLYEIGGVPKEALAASVAVSLGVNTLVFFTSVAIGLLDLKHRPRTPDTNAQT